jgi:hypothetical protein
MLCLTETTDGNVTGVGPAAVSLSHCQPACCRRTVRLQIRSRYSNGSARLCGAFTAPDGDGTVYYTHLNTVIVYHRFKNGSPPVGLGTCTYTEDSDNGTVAIVTGSSSLPDCGGYPAEGTWSPADCNTTLYDPPTDYVTTDPAVITVSGASATKEDVRGAALGAMVTSAWSDWADVCSVDIADGTPEAGYLYLDLAEASCDDNGFGGGEFQANARQYESELRVLGAFSISIAVSEGTDVSTAPVNHYVLDPGSPKSFSVGAPSFADGWVSGHAVLRCACPVRFAAA